LIIKQKFESKSKSQKSLKNWKIIHFLAYTSTSLE